MIKKSGKPTITISLLLFIVSIAFFFASFYAHKGSPDDLNRYFESVPEYVNDAYLHNVAVKALSFGILLNFAGIFLILLRRKADNHLLNAYLSAKKTLVGSIYNIRNIHKSMGLISNLTFWLILISGIILRLIFLDQPMRFDEAFSYQHFITKPFFLTVSYYSAPNNHILYNVIARFLMLIFGDSSFVLRLPALFSGVFLMPLFYYLGRTLFDKYSALLLMALSSSSSVLILFSTTARGYTLHLLIVTLMILCALHYVRHCNTGSLIWLALLSAIGAINIPITILSFSGVAVYIYFSKKFKDNNMRILSPEKALLILLSLTGLITLLLYMPLITFSGIRALVANHFLTADYWALSSFTHFLETVWQNWTAGMPFVLKVFLIMGILVFPITGDSKKEGWHLLSAFLFTGTGLAVIFGSIGPSRIWLHLWPLLFLIPVYSLGKLLQLFFPSILGKEKRRVIMCTLVIVLLSGILSLNIVLTRAPYYSDITGTLRDAEDISVDLSEMLQDGDRVLNSHFSEAPLYYYLKRKGFSVSSLFLPKLENAERFFIILNHRYDQRLDDILELNGMKGMHELEVVHPVRRYEFSSLYIFTKEDMKPSE